MYPNSKTKVIKVYHQPRSKTFEDVLLKLSKLSNKFVKPNEILYTKSGDIAGFVMKFINFNKYFLLNNLFNKGFTNKNNISEDLKLSILNEIKTSVEECHKQNIVIGDLNQYNIFFNLKGEVVFIDVDSYTPKGHKSSGILLEDIRDFTQTEINEQSDSFAFDILSFWALTYCHPFKWVVPGNKETLEQRVLSGKSYLTKIPNIKIPPLYQDPASNLKNQFVEVFEKKRRFMVDLVGSVGQISIQVPVKTSLISKDVKIFEIDNGTDLMCNQHFVWLKKGNVWQVFNTRNKGVLIAKQIIECDVLFLSENHFCYLKQGDMFSESGEKLLYNTDDCSYFYQNNQLFVLNSFYNECLVYQIENQLSRVENLKHVVFAESFIIRNAIMQNFGARKVLINLQNKNLSQVQIPNSTKDLIVKNNYFCAEFLENGKIKSGIYQMNGSKSELILYTDNLVDFTVNQELIFVPSDSEILVYHKGQNVGILSVPVCTKNSKLHYCDAGIVLFENNKLYLLNKT